MADSMSIFDLRKRGELEQFEQFVARAREHRVPGTTALVRVGRRPYCCTIRILVREDHRITEDLVGVGRLRLGNVVKVPLQDEVAYRRAWDLLLTDKEGP